MSNLAHANFSKTVKAADVPRLLYIASACRLWLREYRAVRRDRKQAQVQSRWDWSSSNPVMR